MTTINSREEHLALNAARERLMTELENRARFGEELSEDYEISLAVKAGWLAGRAFAAQRTDGGAEEG